MERTALSFINAAIVGIVTLNIIACLAAVTYETRVHSYDEGELHGRQLIKNFEG